MVYGALGFPGVDPAGQNAVARAVNDPSSPDYHHFLDSSQFDSLFAPPVSKQTEFLDYLVVHGVQVDPVSPYLWNVEGSAGAVGAAFHTEFVEVPSAGGAVGYGPAHPLEVPSAYRGLVDLQGGFQSFDPPTPTGFTGLVNGSGHSASLRAPAGGFSFNVTSPFVWNPPTGFNNSYTVTINGGTPPYNITWAWGDGSVDHLRTSSTTVTTTHVYSTPTQVDYCTFSDIGPGCRNFTVYVNDSAGYWYYWYYHLYVGLSPLTLQRFYNTVGLYSRGDSGQGTKIGLDELCDPSFSHYLQAANNFSGAMHLPTFTGSSLRLVGSGATSCPAGTGSTNWSGETLLDIEWAHALAPNATLVVDLARSSLNEGDATWNNLSNGVYVDSNSWDGELSSSAAIWAKAAAQGQTYLTASGDCGAVVMSWGPGTDPPASDPNGLGVGGTQVYPTEAGTFGAEYAWNGTNDPGCESTHLGRNDAGSGGGYATSIAAPAYQQGMLGFSGTARGVPDVAAIGGTWAMYFDPIGGGGWGVGYGTSLASPAWAAVLDLLYQYNGTADAPNGLANWGLYSIAKGSNYDEAFHDITVGNNIVGSYGGYNATPGWDAVTGLGSPNAAQLAMLLSAQNGNPAGIGPLEADLVTNLTFGPPTLSVAFGALASGGSMPLGGYVYNWSFGDGSTARSTAPTIDHLYDVPGAYSATVTVLQGTNSAVSSPVTVRVSGAPPTKYPVTFAESGLPTGTRWSVVLANATMNSTSTSITFAERNGTYSFGVDMVAGYTVSPASGQVAVNGQGPTESVTFVAIPPTLYAVSFAESGLNPGTTWAVGLEGTFNSSTASVLGFRLANGTYAFTVTSVLGYTDNPGSGSIVVAGAAVEVGIVFRPLPPENFSVTFEEAGLSTGTAWSVTLGGTTEMSNGSSLAFREPNGSYAFVVGSVANHAPSPASGLVTVNGSAKVETVHFVEKVCCPAPSPFWGLFGAPGYDGLFFLLVAIVIIVGTGGALRRRKRKPPTIPSHAEAVPGK